MGVLLCSTVVVLCAHVFVTSAISANDVRIICDNVSPQDIKTQKFCDALEEYVKSGQHGTAPWEDGSLTQDDESVNAINNVKRMVDHMFFGIRNRRNNPTPKAPRPMFFGIRNRRGGGYIRFGRSADSTLSNAQAYMDSFGQPDRRSGNDYMRFGRSVSNVEDEKPVADEGSQLSDDKDKRYMRFGRAGLAYSAGDKRYMRFGRAQQNDDEKRYMRFGRANEILEAPASGDDISEDKRYMRFGRDPSNSGADMDKRYMRFGRSGTSNDNDIDNEKRYMRFGKRGDDMTEDKRYMRFGKRYMRFGKRGDEDDVEKRYMRFGKRMLGNKIKLGKKSDNVVDADNSHYLEFDDQDNSVLDENRNEKRYMRFGKKSSNVENEKRYMRFGKREQDLEVDEDRQDLDDISDIEQEKRYMRFGKRGDSDIDKNKRYMRFGKKDEIDSMETDKRYMRFGKRSTDDDVEQLENKSNLAS